MWWQINDEKTHSKLSMANERGLVLFLQNLQTCVGLLWLLGKSVVTRTEMIPQWGPTGREEVPAAQPPLVSGPQVSWWTLVNGRFWAGWAWHSLAIFPCLDLDIFRVRPTINVFLQGYRGLAMRKLLKMEFFKLEGLKPATFWEMV